MNSDDGVFQYSTGSILENCTRPWLEDVSPKKGQVQNEIFPEKTVVAGPSILVPSLR
jgi:hypothetical protein